MPEVKILITEDESIVARDLASRLQKMGYVITEVVDSGKSAIESVLRHQPDLILMDIMLQGEIDGIETAAKIQTIAKIPIVYLTAYADRETLKRAKATHPFGYLLKPFKEKELQVTLEIALSRHQAEVEFQKAVEVEYQTQYQAQIQEKQAEITRKSLYLSMLSHDFRTPLSIVKLAAEVLQHQSQNLTEEKKQKRFRSIQTAVTNMDQLLSDVLAMEQTDAASLKFSPARLDLVAFSRDVVETVQSLTNQNTLIFTSSLPENARPCLDEQLLWHLLNNLLSNAIKYSPQGGNIWLTLSGNDREICIQVEDRGIGIPLEYHSNLFKPFQRADNVGRIPGTGLGLAISKQCVDLHQGQIAVESEEGKGTKFTVTLPIPTPIA